MVHSSAAKRIAGTICPHRPHCCLGARFVNACRNAREMFLVVAVMGVLACIAPFVMFAFHVSAILARVFSAPACSP
jgi:hypothetical protein